ncbi:hypothetical protein BS47DRAFT_1335986 [Hydnum rufescens UP504]|uniref:Uncharacterized protein n=1 Tax=Hydnum rufescens UP504 TaxID=1448309 RepID=A0A9P6DZB3_9AGAM|nr:hypothetical protein BS47DRAFT_1335986 [Hydnum rufescens UP504]
MFPWSGPVSNDGESNTLLSPRLSTPPILLSPVTTRASEKQSGMPPRRFGDSGERLSSEETRPTITRDETPHDQAVRSLGIGTFISPHQSQGNKPSQEDPSAPRNDAPQGPGSTQHQALSANEIFSPGPEDIFDPATGALIGVMYTPSPLMGDTAQSTAEPSLPKRSLRADSDSTAMSEPTENIWAQLSKIRTLQSDIARMHLALDGPGIVDGAKDRRASAGKVAEGRNRSASDAASFPDDEFAKRRESIALVLAKLDSLSEAVTAFHRIPTPQLRFPPPSSATHSRAGSLSPSNSLPPDPLLPLLIPSPRMPTSNDATQKPSHASSSIPHPKGTPSPPLPYTHNPRLEAPSNTSHPPRLKRLETLYEPTGNTPEESASIPPTAPFAADPPIRNPLFGMDDIHHDSPVSTISSLKYDYFGRPSGGGRGSDSAP